MNNYTMFCTPEQTKRALELGAPIDTDAFANDSRPHTTASSPKRPDFTVNCVIPTTEEMIGWLEDQRIYINLDTTSEEDENHNLIIKWQYYIYNRYHDIVNEEYIEYSTRKEAILVAIGKALEYLSNSKK